MNLKGKKVFVVTNPELGWDCVTGVYLAESEDALKEHLGSNFDEEIDVIHEQFGIDEVFTKAEKRDQKIDDVIK